MRSPTDGVAVTAPETTARGRLVYRVVAVLGVVPIAVEVVRRGLTGWIPVLDAAPTVVRAKYALGTSPTLVGMFTDSSRYTGAATYFPGAWQLYWLWAPIRLFGSNWGPLIGMGLLNIGWFLLAGWFVKRRLGHRAGAAALCFAAVLNWVLSPALLVSPVPMVMVLPAFVAFCFGSWALAAGDEGVLPLLAVVANFLLLDHLVLTVLVPAIGGVALACWVGGVLWQWRRRPDGSWPDRRRRSLRAVGGGLAVTAIMWLPVVVQQLTHSPGNLSNLWRAGRSQPDTVLSTADAGRRWLSLFVPPDFWLRPSRTSSYLLSTAPPPSTMAVAAVLSALGLLALVLAASAFRRRDRAASSALFLAAVASVASVATIVRAVGQVQNPYPSYVQSTWVVAMFVTFALAYGIARAAPRRLRGLGTGAVAVAAVVVAVVNLPHAAVTYGVTVAPDRTVDRSRALNTTMLDAVGDGSVAVRTSGYGAYPYTAAAIVALDAAGVRFCADAIQQFEPSPIPACGSRKLDHEIRFVRGDGSDEAVDGWRVLGTATSLSPADEAELTRSTDRVRAGVATATSEGRGIRFAPAFRRLVETEHDLADVRANVADDSILNPPGGLMTTPAGRQRLALLVHMAEDVIRDHPSFDYPDDIPPVQIPGVDRSELLRWADLTQRSVGQTGSVLIRSAR